jgi:hypothetical protein
MLGLWRIASWLRTTESDVGSRNFRAVNSIDDSSTPCCAMCGIATYTLQYRSVHDQMTCRIEGCTYRHSAMIRNTMQKMIKCIHQNLAQCLFALEPYPGAAYGCLVSTSSALKTFSESWDPFMMTTNSAKTEQDRRSNRGWNIRRRRNTQECREEWKLRKRQCGEPGGIKEESGVDRDTVREAARQKEGGQWWIVGGKPTRAASPSTCDPESQNEGSGIPWFFLGSCSVLL